MSHWIIKVYLVAACVGVYWIQSAIDERAGLFRSTEEALYLPSGTVIKRLSLGHNGLMADIYWMRTVQYYGGKRLMNDKRFDLLEPLIDIATTLDPQLLHAYRFGSVFLSEDQPVGANQPEKAIVLLKKGIKNNPDEWQLYRDVGFVYYWFLHDYKKAAEAFLEGSKNPRAAIWMRTFAAELLAKGGSRETARFLWQEVYQTSENQQMRDNAKEHLFRLSAEEEIEIYQALVEKVESKIGGKISSFQELVNLGFFKELPVDPKGFEYIISSETGRVSLSPESTIRRY